MKMTEADYKRVLAAVERYSINGTRSITIPNGEVPVIIAALRLALSQMGMKQ